MKQGTLLLTAYPIVESDRPHSGLIRTVFKPYGISKMTREDSDHMCGDESKHTYLFV